MKYIDFNRPQHNEDDGVLKAFDELKWVDFSREEDLVFGLLESSLH